MPKIGFLLNNGISVRDLSSIIDLLISNNYIIKLYAPSKTFKQLQKIFPLILELESVEKFFVSNKIIFLQKIINVLFYKTSLYNFLMKIIVNIFIDTSIKNSMDIDLLITQTPRYYYEEIIRIIASICNIKTLIIISSWDNLVKGSLRGRGDLLSVWNCNMKYWAIKYHKYKSDNVVITGSINHDIYFKQDIIYSRELFLKKLNIDIKHKIILLGTSGLGRGINEYELFSHIINLLNKDNLTFIVRLHPNETIDGVPKQVTDMLDKNVILSISKEKIEGFPIPQNWYMSKDEKINHINLLYHSNLVITIGSTLSVEACIFGTPSIICGYHPTQNKLFNKILNPWYQKHLKDVIGKDKLNLVRSSHELKMLSWQYLSNSEIFKENANKVVKDVFEYNDGLSNYRIMELIGSMIN